MKLYSSTSIHNESTSERTVRLNDMAERMNILRSTETVEEKRIRTNQNSSHRATKRNNESNEERLTRLTIKKKDIISWKNAGFNYNNSYKYNEDSYTKIGDMDVICKHCNARKYKAEPAGLCCKLGKVVLPKLDNLIEPLNELLKSKHFFNNIRNYNSSFQMTSFGANKIIKDGYNTQVKIQGQVYHLLGSLKKEKDSEKYLQIYFMGNTTEESNRRCSVIPNSLLKFDIISSLQNMLHLYNSKVKSFIYANSNLPDNLKLILSAEKRPLGEHERRFNDPISNEVAVLLVSDK